MNLRNSFHRSGFDANGTPSHGIVGRSSLLQNAQLEVTRVDQKKIAKKENSFSRNLNNTRNRSPFGGREL